MRWQTFYFKNCSESSNQSIMHSLLERIVSIHSFILILLVLSSNSTFAQWVQRGIDIDGEAANDRSGYSVSMPDSGTFAIGAISNDGSGNDAGHVRVYGNVGGNWVRQGTDIDGEAANDNFGFSVSMPDYSCIAIGGRRNDGNGTDAGHVRVFRWTGLSWIQKGADIDGESTGDESGISVQMPDSNTVAIGAHLNDGNGTNAGHVRVFRWVGNSWIQKGSDMDGEAANDLSGFSISMPDSNTLAIGAYLNDGNGSNSGHVRIFRWNGSSWVQKGNDIDGEAADDLSGQTVCMPDSNTVAIGASANDGTANSAGHARVYRWNGVNWVQKGADIDGEAFNDQSGYCVSMPDSNTIAVGAPNNSAVGSSAGHTRIFQWNGSAWLQKGLDIDAEAALDQSGFFVSMPNSNTIAIGAPNNSGFAQYAGHVRVYSFNPITTLSENKLDKKLAYYPNPSKNIITIEAAEYIGEEVLICNIVGTVLLRFIISKPTQEVDISRLPSGMYFFRMEGFTKKVLVEK